MDENRSWNLVSDSAKISGVREEVLAGKFVTHLEPGYHPLGVIELNIHLNNARVSETGARLMLDMLQ